MERLQGPTAGPIRTLVVELDLRMRSLHVEYLEYVAERDDVSLSHALTLILDEKLATYAPASVRRSEKARVHLCVPERCLAILDRLALETGRSRTEAAMRVIETARENDPPRRLAVGA